MEPMQEPLLDKPTEVRTTANGCPDESGMELGKEIDTRERMVVGLHMINGKTLLKVRIHLEKEDNIKNDRGDLFLILRSKYGNDRYFGDPNLPVGEGTLETVFSCIKAPRHIKDFKKISKEIGDSIRQIDKTKNG